MNNKNHLRKLYLVYLITISELFCAVLVTCALSILPEPWKMILMILGITGALAVPAVTFFFYRWVKRDNESNSDELEQMVLTKALALAGFCAISLSPFILFFTFMFSSAAGYIVFGYTALVAGTFKISTYYYHKKY